MKIEFEKEVIVEKTFKLNLKEVKEEDAPVDIRPHKWPDYQYKDFRLYNDKIYEKCCYYNSDRPVIIHEWNYFDILDIIRSNIYGFYTDNNLQNIKEKELDKLLKKFQKNVIIIDGILYHVRNFENLD